MNERDYNSADGICKIDCDHCDRRKQCNDEDRLITYFTFSDNWMDPAYEKNGHKAAHGMLRMGERCPLKAKKEILKELEEEDDD